MAPQSNIDSNLIICEKDELNVETLVTDEKPSEWKKNIVWRNAIVLILMHLGAFYGLYLAVFYAQWKTNVWAFILHQLGGLGITVGAHRLWGHRAFKAKTPLKILLVIINTLTFQNPAYVWARDHRTHHKFSETDADPHNAKRGMFYTHFGYLCVKKHPEVFRRSKIIDFSDLYGCPILMFQRRHYHKMVFVITFLIPTLIPMFLWGETFQNSLYVSTFLQIIVTLNCTLMINSVAHKYGNKPYEKNIGPTDNLIITALTLGDGWHNYHHVFPWDYRTTELGKYSINTTTTFIELMAKIGWAYDLKTISPELVKKRVQRTGDGSHEIWGWGDKNQPQEERNLATILAKEKMSFNQIIAPS